MAHVGEELRLVLACFRQLAALLLNFVEQPHVLDCDHRLVREGGCQFDLLVREGAYGLAPQNDNTNRGSFSQEWNPEYGVEAYPL